MDYANSGRRGAWALGIGGLIWALAMVAYTKTHGTTSHDYKRYLFTLTWYDYMKFLPVAGLLLAYGLADFRRRLQDRAGSLFAMAAGVAVGALVLVAIGQMVEFWPIPWQEYWTTHLRVPHRLVGGITSMLSFFVLGLCLLICGIGLLRARVAPAGALFLPLALIAAAPWQAVSPPGIAFGALWVLVALLSGIRREEMRHWFRAGGWAAVLGGAVWLLDVWGTWAGLVRHSHSSGHLTLGLPLVPMAIVGLRSLPALRDWRHGTVGGYLFAVGLAALAPGQIVESFGSPFGASLVHTAGVIPSALGMMAVIIGFLLLVMAGVRLSMIPAWVAVAVVGGLFLLIWAQAEKETAYSAQMLIFSAGFGYFCALLHEQAHSVVNHQGFRGMA